MSAESFYDPIPVELIRKARAQLVLEGKTIDDWARENGYPAKAVYSVLSGSRMCIRGESLAIAKKLGLRPDKAATSHIPAAPPPHVTRAPAGRTIAGGAPVVAGDRRPISPVGEPVS